MFGLTHTSFSIIMPLWSSSRSPRGFVKTEVNSRHCGLIIFEQEEFLNKWFEDERQSHRLSG